MALDTVEHAVAALVALYEGALDDYTQWRRRVRQDNHYRTRDRGGPSAPGACALSASLRYSAARIRDTFENGRDVLGPDFAAGDKPCFQLLLDNLGRLEARVDGLRRHAWWGDGGGGGPGAAPLELRETLRASEIVRAAALRALAEQYHRVAVSRLASPRPARPAADDDGDNNNNEGDEEAPSRSSLSSSLTICRRAARPGRPPPPSPPPTPTPTRPAPPPPDDAQSTCTAGTGPRPRASVFSLFCPEAVKYQVDLTRAAPRGPCRRCGYAWGEQEDPPGDRGARGRPPLLLPLLPPPPSPSPPAPAAAASPPVALRDGFRLTARFLGKSHCGGGAFACVLCTSRGATALYATVAALRDHINLAHDKWQMLHERDLSAR